MSDANYLGKDKLKEFNLKFIIVNQPVFVASAHPQKTLQMKTHNFPSMESAVEFVKNNYPLVIFDMPTVYKKTYNYDNNISLRCCPITLNDVQTVKNNLKEPKDVIYRYDWDFSCF